MKTEQQKTHTVKKIKSSNCDTPESVKNSIKKN